MHTFKSKQWRLCIKLEIRKRRTRNNVEEHVEIKIKLRKSLLCRSTLKLSSVQCARFTLLNTSANFKQKREKKKKKKKKRIKNIFWKWRQQFKRFKCNSCQFILSLSANFIWKSNKHFRNILPWDNYFLPENWMQYEWDSRERERESVCVFALACMHVCV